MIAITRPNLAPATLSSQKVLNAIKMISDIATQRKPLSKEFVSHWGEDDIRTALWEMQHHKCCYCERKREKNRESDIEHFRPKAEVTEASASHRGYWWLAYKWENLFFSCRYCNQQYKKNRFPVANEANRAQTEKCLLANEDCYLIDPTEKDPEEEIGFDWYDVSNVTSGSVRTLAFARGRSIYGAQTIDIVGLNDSDLPMERGDLVMELKALATLMHIAEAGHGKSVEERKKEIQLATSSSQPFAAFRRDFFRKNGLGDYVSTD